MSVKNYLLKKINQKANKIKEKRIDAANNKSLEAAVFDFFKNIEESIGVKQDRKYDGVMFAHARRSLEERIRGFDPKAKVSIEYNLSGDMQTGFTREEVRGVTIWWSQAYIQANSVAVSLYIDVSQMLLGF